MLDPSFPHRTDAAQRLRPDKSSSAFSKPEIPVCREHTIQIREKRKTAPRTKNSRNAIRINLFYAEVKRRRRRGWGGGGGGCVTIAGTLDTVTCCTFGWTYKKMFLIAEMCLKNASWCAIQATQPAKAPTAPVGWNYRRNKTQQNQPFRICQTSWCKYTSQ